MKKYIFLSAGLCLAMMFTSCGSSEKAYRKAYEKAQGRARERVARRHQAEGEGL